MFMLTVVEVKVLARCILNANELTSVCFWPELQLFLVKTEISLFGKFRHALIVSVMCCWGKEGVHFFNTVHCGLYKTEENMTQFKKKSPCFKLNSLRWIPNTEFLKSSEQIFLCFYKWKSSAFNLYWRYLFWRIIIWLDITIESIKKSSGKCHWLMACDQTSKNKRFSPCFAWHQMYALCTLHTT